MKNITSTFGIVLAAGLTIGAIAAVSIAEGQMYTKGAVVQTPQTNQPFQVRRSCSKGLKNRQTLEPFQSRPM